MNTLDLLNKGSKKLKYKGIKSSQIDSEILLSNILGKSRENKSIALNHNWIGNTLSPGKVGNKNVNREKNPLIVKNKAKIIKYLFIDI